MKSQPVDAQRSSDVIRADCWSIGTLTSMLHWRPQSPVFLFTFKHLRLGLICPRLGLSSAPLQRRIGPIESCSTCSRRRSGRISTYFPLTFNSPHFDVFQKLTDNKLFNSVSGLDMVPFDYQKSYRKCFCFLGCVLQHITLSRKQMKPPLWRKKVVKRSVQTSNCATSQQTWRPNQHSVNFSFSSVKTEHQYLI